VKDRTPAGPTPQHTQEAERLARTMSEGFLRRQIVALAQGYLNLRQSREDGVEQYLDRIAEELYVLRLALVLK